MMSFRRFGCAARAGPRRTGHRGGCGTAPRRRGPDLGAEGAMGGAAEAGVYNTHLPGRILSTHPLRPPNPITAVSGVTGETPGVPGGYGNLFWLRDFLGGGRGHLTLSQEKQSRHERYEIRPKDSGRDDRTERNILA